MERLDGIVRSPLDPHYMAERNLTAAEIVGARALGDCLELSGIGDIRGEHRRDGRRPAKRLSEMRAQLANPTAETGAAVELDERHDTACGIVGASICETACMAAPKRTLVALMLP
jgi:hypothetical protein